MEITSVIQIPLFCFRIANKLSTQPCWRQRCKEYYPSLNMKPWSFKFLAHLLKKHLLSIFPNRSISIWIVPLPAFTFHNHQSHWRDLQSQVQICNRHNLTTHGRVVVSFLMVGERVGGGMSKSFRHNGWLTKKKLAKMPKSSPLKNEF